MRFIQFNTLMYDEESGEYTKWCPYIFHMDDIKQVLQHNDEVHLMTEAGDTYLLAHSFKDVMNMLGFHQSQTEKVVEFHEVFPAAS